MSARAVVAEIPDKRIAPILAYFELARKSGLSPRDADTDLLLSALLRAWEEYR
mgnify:CR=1 FL=1